MHGKRERVDGGSSGGLNLGGNCGSGSLCPPKSSPCSIGDSIHDHDSDKFSDTGMFHPPELLIIADNVYLCTWTLPHQEGFN